MIASLDRTTSSSLEAARGRRGGDCLSHLTLDRFALAELPDDEARAVAAHLDRCARCAESHQVLTADRAAFAREAAFPTLAADAIARVESRTWWRRFGRWFLDTRFSMAFVRWLLRAPIPVAIGAGAITAALAVALFVSPRMESPSAGGGFATKGDFSLSAYVLHREAVGRPGTPHMGETLHPGDRLQFRYNGKKGGYLAVVAIDADGAVDVYYPPGAVAERVEPGRDIQLRSAVELDATLGREVIIAVRCTEPLAVSEVAGAARREADRARAAGGRPTDLGGLGLPCIETRHEIAKSALRPAP